MKRNRRTITIQDVARAAGVSVSTVSRVLNGKDDVAEETLETVQKVIKDLGYASSLAARGMRSHRTGVIGMVMPDIASMYCVDVMRGVNQAIMKLDFDLIIYTNGDIRKYGTADQERRYVALLNGSITDGVVVVAPSMSDFVTNAPVVIIDPNGENPAFPAVVSDNHEAALNAMSYLTGLGHRRIGFITGRLELVSARLRLQGYKDGLAAAGIPVDDCLIQVGDYTDETAEGCACALLSLKDRPTAIFASNDMSALGVYHAARQMGLRIPEDISVVGFDNVSESGFFDPPLTTIDQFLADMGTTAIEMIAKLIKGEALDSNLHKIQTQLVVRDSCVRKK
jgi:LacI family transcriptional regulator